MERVIWTQEEEDQGIWLYTTSLVNDPIGTVTLEYESQGVTMIIELPPAALKALAARMERNPGKECDGR